MKQQQPDPLSLEFMNWSMKYLSNRSKFEQLVNDIFNNATDYYSNNPEKIKQDIWNKLYLGSLEHGAPVYTKEWLQEEFNQELKDLIGYGLLIIWNRERTT